jgi:hypothetical protein
LAAVDLYYAIAAKVVILTTQVVVRIDVRWLSLQGFASWAQGHMSIPRASLGVSVA